MNKKEAAETLGKSPRTIAEYVSSGRLKCIYINGKNGQEASFDEADVRKLKEEIDTPSHRAVVVAPGGETALAIRGESQERFLNALETVFAKQANAEPLLTELDVKPILKLSEAQRLTGIPRSILMDAIRAGKLAADDKKWGRGWRMKRADLDAFIAKA